MILASNKRFLIAIVAVFVLTILYFTVYISVNFLADRAYAAENASRAELYYKIITYINPFAKTAYARLGFLELNKNRLIVQSLQASLSGYQPAYANNTFLKSAKYSERALKLGLRESWVYYNAAAAYDNTYLIESRKSGGRPDPSRAISYYQKSIEIDSNNLASRNNLGSIYFQEGKYDLVIDQFQKIIDINKDDARIRALIGFSYEFIKEYRQALPYLEEAVRLNYKNYAFPFIIHLREGVIYYELKEYDKAIEEETKAITLYPQASAAYYYRGLSYLSKRNKTDDLKKSEKDFKTYLQISPNGLLSNEAKNYLEKIKTNQYQLF